MKFTLNRNRPEAMFLPIQIGNWTVSIQASAKHYCSPRATFMHSSGYSEFEVAIFEKNNEWFIPGEDYRFAKKEWAEYWSGDQVAGYMPREIVKQMLDDLDLAK